MIELTGLSALQQFRLWVCVINPGIGKKWGKTTEAKTTARAEVGKAITVLSALKKMNLDATLYDFKDYVS